MPYIKDSWCWSVQSLETEDTNNLLRFKDRCREQTRNLYQMIITVCEQELIDAIQRSIMLWEHRFHAVNEVLRHRSREGDRISRVSKGSFVVGDRVRLTDDAQDPCVEFGTITGGKCEEGWGVNNYTVHWDGFSTPIYVRCEELVLALTCAVCHPDEANPKVKYCRKCRPVGVNRSSELNNMVANTGCDRCSCGNKYWRDDTCIDCGTKHTDIDWKVNLWGLNPDTDVWEWVDICKWTTQKWAFLDGYKETYDVLEWRRDGRSLLLVTMSSMYLVMVKHGRVRVAVRFIAQMKSTVV